MNWHHDLEMLKEIHQSFQNYWQMRTQFYQSIFRGCPIKVERKLEDESAKCKRTDLQWNRRYADSNASLHGELSKISARLCC